MERQFFNLGQEVISADLNSLQSRIERGFLDYLIYELLGRRTDAFFQGGLKVLRVDANTYRIKAGLGIQSHADDDTKEPTKKPILLTTDTDLDINSAHATLPRIDGVFVKATRVNSEEENRRYKEEFVDTIFSQTMVISTKPSTTISYVAGVANAVPVAPATPAGFIKIAEIYVTAVTGIASQAAITDTRTLLPVVTNSTYNGATYDAVVGSGPFCTHATLNDVMSDLNAANIKNILVESHPALAATQVINQNDVRIEFKKGSSLTAGAEVTLGLNINANGCEVLGAKVSGFTTGIEIQATKKNNLISRCRFVACTSDISDNGTNNELTSNMVEV